MEEVVILASLSKWVILATIVGALIGVAVSLFLEVLDWGVSLRPDAWWGVFLLPPAGYVTGWLIHRFAPDAEGHGTEAVIRAIHRRWGKIRAEVIPIKALATIISLAAGGSAGKEGPSAQIGSGVASVVADIIGLGNKDRRKLVVCGISAGFAGVFGLPIAGTLFGVEVLSIGSVFYEYLLPSFVAGTTSFVISRALGVTHPDYATQLPGLGESVLIKMLLFGVIIGLISLIFIETLESTKNLFDRLPTSRPMKAAIGGVALAMLFPLIGTRYMGLSLDLLNGVMAGGAVVTLAFLWKIVATSVTLGSGWSGGIVTPIFVIGATAGAVFAPVFGFSPQIGASLGMVGLVSGAANTPLAAILMGVEIFGPEIGVYVAAVAIAAFLVSGHRSVYPSQILAFRKAPSIRVGLNRSLEECGDIHVNPRTYRYLWRRWARKIIHAIRQDHPHGS